MPIHKDRFHELQMRYRDAALFAVDELRKKKADETLYAFALYTDDDCCATSAAANTEQALQRKLDNEVQRAKQGGKPALQQADLDYYRWATSEWEYEGVGAEHFPSYDVMLPMQEGMSHKAFRRAVLAAMVRALKDLDDSGVFSTGSERERITLFVSITDSDEAFLVENHSARKLNPGKVARRFCRRSNWKLRMLARLAALASRFRR